MAIAALMEFSGITAEQYDAVIADMDLNGTPAAHAIFHVAGPTDGGGWRIVDVRETAEAFDDFAKNQIMPLAMKHGMKQPPKVDVWPVHNMLK